MGKRRFLPVAFAATVAVAAALLTPAASAKNSHCLVINAAANASYTTLQAGVDAASAGDTLWVRGTCQGTTTISTPLTIIGQQPHGFTAPTLDGNGQAGSVLTICATTSLDNLTITGGTGDAGTNICGINYGGATFGGGITAHADLMLNNSTVTDNTASGGGYGGGIVVLDGSVTLTDSTITYNTATGGGGGGGIYVSNHEGAAATLDGTSTIENNTAGVGSGGGVLNSGTFTMNDTSTITYNTAGQGGGVYNDGTFTMNDTSTITDNTALSSGGGIYNALGTLNGVNAATSPTCPDTSSFNVYCNSPDNLYSV